MRVDPAGHFINWIQDPQGNYLARLVFPEKVREFRIEVDLVAEAEAHGPRQRAEHAVEPGVHARRRHDIRAPRHVEEPQTGCRDAVAVAGTYDSSTASSR